MLIRLKQSGAFETAEAGDMTTIPTFLDKRARFVYAGKFMSMDGEVEVTKENLEALVKGYNGRLAKLKRLASGAPRLMEPIQLDHTRSARDTVGRLVGEIALEDFEMDDGTIAPAVYGNVRILGRENVERVLDGRWSELSIGADFEASEISELSVTPFPAAKGSSLLSKGDGNDNNDDEEKKMNRAKLKKYLTGVKKMSDDDAEKELNRLAEKDDEAKKLSEEADEHDKKLAEDEKASKDQKLAAARTTITRLSTDFRAKATSANLAAKSSRIIHRLSSLRSSGKVTPAEIKKLGITELAGKSDDAIDAVMKSYEDREPVIMVGTFGTMKGMSHAQLEGMAKKKRLRQLEAESRANMTSLSSGGDDDQKKKDDEKKLAEEDAGIHMDTEANDTLDLAALEGEYTSVCKMMDEGKMDEVKARLKTWMGRMASGGAFAAPEPTIHEQSGQQLAALQKDIAQLTANFEEVLGLAESLATAG